MPEQDPACLCMICRNYGDRARLDTADTSLVANIGEYGWGIIMIGANEISEGWAFTVGLWHSHRIPELAMFGLDISRMKTCLNLLAGRILAGEPAVAEARVDDVLTNSPVLLKAVDPDWYRAFFGTAGGFYRATRGVPFLQALWPDKSGLFPGEPDFAPQLCEHQPSLWLHPSEHPDGPWTEHI